MIMMMDRPSLSTLLASLQVAACCASVLLLVKAMRSPLRLSTSQEQEVYAFKVARVLAYWVLSAGQAGLLAWQLLLRDGITQQQPQQVLQVNMEGSALLLAWATPAVWLSLAWSRQGSARLLPIALAALLAGSAQLASDCVASLWPDDKSNNTFGTLRSSTSSSSSRSSSTETDGLRLLLDTGQAWGVGISSSTQDVSTGLTSGLAANGPDDAMQQLVMCRVIIHALLLVVLMGLAVVEMVVLGHIDAALAARQAGSMLGEEEDQAGGVAAAAAEAIAAAEKAARKAAKAKHKAPKATRAGMASAAFRYMLPDDPGLRVRLLGCFILVAGERGINLAVPVLYKKMVDTLSEASSLHTAAAGANTILQQLLVSTFHSTSVGPTATGTPTTAAETMGASTSVLEPGRVGLEQQGPLLGCHTADALQGSTQTLQTFGAQMLMSMASSFWPLFFPWVAAYLGCWYLKGGSGMEGLLSSCRDILWAPITQAAYRRVSRDVFGHLLALDHSFHIKRKTGQVMRILDRGTSSIQDTVSIVLFNVVPQLADIAVACTYLAVAMQPWAAAIVAVTVASYVPLTVWITERRGAVRKRMNALDNAREARATDMLLNYETVKLFNAEPLELEGYDAATRVYQAAEYWQLAFLSLLAIAQGTCVWGGMVAGCVICVRGVAGGTLTVGDAVLFITLMNQLYVPLTYFGSYYRQVQKALIDVENMFELLATEPKVKNAPGAKPLRIVTGAVAFDRVVFGYGLLPTIQPPTTPTSGATVITINPDDKSTTVTPKSGSCATDRKANGVDGQPAATTTVTLVPQPVLKGISFAIPGGSTLAVVGSSGSGKSTLLKLLLRFYDPWSGAVLVDGQDIAKATLASVRQAISVVPQDAVLFNQSVAYNIRYGAPGATSDEVEEAAESAAVHATISGFKKGYNTRVGERGLRLSGGEKQRVAFARAILKKPAILILDEATSALDSLTEAAIQSSLAALRGRMTSVVVAHRLSTIKDADRIMVLHGGKISECGSHTELLESGGLYAAMWNRQKVSLQDDSQALLDELTQQQAQQQQQTEQQAKAEQAEPEQQPQLTPDYVQQQAVEQLHKFTPSSSGLGLDQAPAGAVHIASSTTGSGAELQAGHLAVAGLSPNPVVLHTPASPSIPIQRAPSTQGVVGIPIPGRVASGQGATGSAPGLAFGSAIAASSISSGRQSTDRLTRAGSTTPLRVRPAASPSASTAESRGVAGPSSSPHTPGQPPTSALRKSIDRIELESSPFASRQAVTLTGVMGSEIMHDEDEEEDEEDQVQDRETEVEKTARNRNVPGRGPSSGTLNNRVLAALRKRLSRNPTPHRSRAAHDRDEDDLTFVQLNDGGSTSDLQLLSPARSSIGFRLEGSSPTSSVAHLGAVLPTRSQSAHLPPLHRDIEEGLMQLARAVRKQASDSSHRSADYPQAPSVGSSRASASGSGSRNGRRSGPGGCHGSGNGDGHDGVHGSGHGRGGASG